MTTAAPSAPAIAAPLLWSTLASLGTQVLGFGTFAILARLLGAQTFGLVALAALVIDLLLVISTAGINEAVIQRRHLDEVDADTAFWGNLAMGTAFCIATIAGAPLIATAFHQPALSQVIMALAAIFAITPLGAIHTARLTRDLRFRAVASRNLIAALAGAIAGIPLAFLGFGVWALVAQRIASTAALVLASWWSYPWLPRLRWHRQSLIEMVRFGAYLGASRTLNQLNIRAAEMISGALVGPVAVAFIRAGSRVVEVVNQVTYMPVQQIAMPILTRVNHDPAALREAYLKLSRLSAFLMFPAFFGCLAIAPLIVQLVFGPGWEPVADALRIFTLAVVASQINNLIVAVIAALGESRAVLSWTGAQIGLGIAAAVAVAPWGWQAMLLTGVLRGYLVLPYGFHLLRRHAGIRFRDVLSSIAPALASSLLMAMAVAAGLHWSPAALPLPALLALCLPAGALVYLAAYLWQDRTILAQLSALLATRRARAGV
ncbi:lipopolysaccharide biosynthesis protein [Novosphingobium colocasiae]|uniref:Lipopolysaccharide biosynthesis protein n=1 Tax=Novosphingobium colocasiae TaxID=1256513 RepID=A0A918UGN5_9SPHN|nr:lipopolysaccharide biosynthesis protein [Novosphingobium colocasiae]GGZ05915.1 lipopolysaccharide biosynthesis protein [Novosphingobium colocasiae]